MDQSDMPQMRRAEDLFGPLSERELLIIAMRDQSRLKEMVAELRTTLTLQLDDIQRRNAEMSIVLTELTNSRSSTINAITSMNQRMSENERDVNQTRSRLEKLEEIDKQILASQVIDGSDGKPISVREAFIQMRNANERTKNVSAAIASIISAGGVFGPHLWRLLFP